MTQLDKSYREAIVYPESDGKPIGESTIQFDYIVLIKAGLDYLFSHRTDVFVASDLFWYPVKGHPEIVTAPDIYVVFGRPKGDRASYRQWQEDHIAPQVVFEIWSPSNNLAEKRDKLKFYNQYGALEYYAFDPQTGQLEGWERRNGQLEPIAEMQNWVSPRLQIRFEVFGKELQVYRPDGQVFVNYEVMAQRAEAAQQRATEAERQLESLLAKLREKNIDLDNL